MADNFENRHRCLISRFYGTVLCCVTLCYVVEKLYRDLSLCYTVLCRITNGPFDQEVISSSLTLEDPDLKVSLVPRPSDFISQTGSSFSMDNLLRGHDL